MGIGANTTIFSWLDAILLDPVPGARASSELLVVLGTSRAQKNISLSYPDFLDLWESVVGPLWIVLNCSILDGWWVEGYEPDVGWAIGRGEEYDDPEYQDRQHWFVKRRNGKPYETDCRINEDYSNLFNVDILFGKMKTLPQ